MLRREVQAHNREKTSDYLSVPVPLTQAHCIWEQVAKMTVFIWETKQNKNQDRQPCARVKDFL